MLRVGVVGCGGFFATRAHLPALRQLEAGSARTRGFGVRVVALCARSDASLDQAERRLGPRASAKTKQRQPPPGGGARAGDGDEEAASLTASPPADPLPRRYTSLAALLRDSDVDVVDVVLPIDAAPAAIAAALAAGKHVVSEKPVAPDAAAAASLWTACVVSDIALRRRCVALGQVVSYSSLQIA